MQAAEILASRTPDALPPLPAELRRQAVVMCGWVPFGPDNIVKPHMAVISNYHDEEMTPTAKARTTFRTNTRTLKPREQTAVFAVGEPLRPDREVPLR